jgi:Domain of unknown function (DUF4157)
LQEKEKLMAEYKKPGEPRWGDGQNDEPLWHIPEQNAFGEVNPNPFNPTNPDPSPFEADPNSPFPAPTRKQKTAKQDNPPKKQDTPSAKSEKTEDAETLFGLPLSQLEQQVGSAHSVKESQADAIAKAATSEPSNPEPLDQKENTPVADLDHNIPGLPKQGGTALPRQKKAQFEHKVGNLSDVQVHKTPKHARALGAQAFTVGRHVYMGESAGHDVLNHELGHFHPNDKKTEKIRRKAPNDDWVSRQAEIRRQQEIARAAEKERQRKAAEAEAARLAKIEADRKAAEARQRNQADQALRLASVEKLRQQALLQKRQKHGPDYQLPVKASLPQAGAKPYQKTDLSALKEWTHRQKAEKQQRQIREKALKHQPGILSVLKPPSFFDGAMALSAAVMNPSLSASLVAGSMAWPALATDPKGSRRLLNGAETQSKHSFQGATQLAQASQSAHQGKADPIASFQQTLKRNAQTVLQQNRTRLGQSQQRFSNPDPNNPNWAALRQQGTAVAALNYKTETAKLKLLDLYRKATSDRVSSPFPILDTETSPEARRAMMLGFFQRQLGPNWKTLAPQMQPWVEQFYVADTLRTGLFAKEPALAVLSVGELQQPNTPDHNRQLQQQIAGGFNTTRESIGKLEKGLQNDKDGSLALKFDTVASQTIASIKDPKQRQQVLKWVQAKQKAERDQQLQGAVGLAATTVGAIASYAFGAGILASIFGGAGTILGGKMSLDGISQAGTNLDAVQAGDTGGQRLTAMNPHQAQMDYQMAMVNVGLSLLDAKVAVSSIRQVLGSRQAVQALTKLKPNQVEQFAEATRLQQAGKTAEAKKALQNFLSQSPDLSESEVETLTRLASRKSSIFHEQWNAEVKAYFDKYYGQVGRHTDDVEDLVASSKRKGIKVEEGDAPSFKEEKKGKGTITYSTDGEMPTKRWSYKEEFLHSLVDQAKKRKAKVQPQIDRMNTANQKAAQMGQPLPYSEAEIEQLTPRSLREIDQNKAAIQKARGKKERGDSIAAEEIFVKEWLLKHPKLGEVGEAERILLETQIKRLKQYGLSHGY